MKGKHKRRFYAVLKTKQANKIHSRCMCAEDKNKLELSPSSELSEVSLRACLESLHLKNAFLVQNHMVSDKSHLCLKPTLKINREDKETAKKGTQLCSELTQAAGSTPQLWGPFLAPHRYR